MFSSLAINFKHNFNRNIFSIDISGKHRQCRARGESPTNSESGSLCSPVSARLEQPSGCEDGSGRVPVGLNGLHVLHMNDYFLVI